MMLFPTEFSLRTTKGGIRLCAQPIKEIENLHSKTHRWENLSLTEANKRLSEIKSNTLHVKMNVNLEEDKYLHLMYNGNELFNFSTNDLLKEITIPGQERGPYDIEILIDKTSAEIFLNTAK